VSTHKKHTQYSFQPGQRYNGNLVLAVGEMPSLHADQRCVDFECRDCANSARVQHQTATKWLNNDVDWCCVRCRKTRSNRSGSDKGKAKATLQSAPILAREIRVDGRGVRRLYVTIKCQGDGCGIHFAHQIRVLKMSASRGRPLLCDKCRTVARAAAHSTYQTEWKQKKAAGVAKPKPRAVEQADGGIKLLATTRRLINKLSPKRRAAVEQIVREHLRACLRSGITIEGIDRIWIEAVEIAQINERFPQAEQPVYEPFRRYDQYSAPREQEAA